MSRRVYRVSCDSCAVAVINGHTCHERGCHGVATFVSRGRSYRKYRVWSLDVLGNPRDGFEVNDRSERGTVMLPVDCSDRRLVAALKTAGFIGKRTHAASWGIDGDDRSLSVDWKRTGEPVYSLEAV